MAVAVELWEPVLMQYSCYLASFRLAELRADPGCIPRPWKMDLEWMSLAPRFLVGRVASVCVPCQRKGTHTGTLPS